MEEKLLAAYSVEDIRKILSGPRDEIVQTMRMSSHATGKRVDHLYNLTRGEVLDTIESISKDKELIELILAESRRATKEIRAGATSREGVYPYMQQIKTHFRVDALQKSAFGSFIVNFSKSFIAQKFGNGEDL